MNLKNIQLVFYFVPDISDKLFWLCADLADDSMMQPIIFPIDRGTVPVADMLMAVVPMANKSQLQIHRSLVAVSAASEEDAILVGKKAIDVFMKHGIPFYRIGMIENYAFSGEKVESVKKKVFNESDAPEADFQYSRYYKESLEGVSEVNLWKKYFTNFESMPDLLVEIDINTPVTEKVSVNGDFLEKFVKRANRVITRHFEEDNVL